MNNIIIMPDDNRIKSSNDSIVTTTDANVTSDTNGINILTDEQIGEVYNALKSEDEKSIKALKAAQEMTNNTKYDSIEEIVPNSVEPSQQDYKNVFKEYDITPEEAEKLTKLIVDYRKDKSIKVYDRLPKFMQKLTSAIRMNFNAEEAKSGRKNRVSAESASKLLLDSFISDAEVEAAINQYNEEINKAISDTDKAIDAVFSDAYNEVFSRIDEIRAEDEEIADKLQAIKNAFEDALTFERQLEYVDKVSPNKLKKTALRRFESEAYYFNKKVNVTDVKIPDITELIDIIKLHCPQFDELDIRQFLVLLSKSIYDLDMSKINNVAYVYRMIDSVYKYKFISAALEDENSKALFGNIAKVINKIVSL